MEKKTVTLVDVADVIDSHIDFVEESLGEEHLRQTEYEALLDHLVGWTAIVQDRLDQGAQRALEETIQAVERCSTVN